MRPWRCGNDVHESQRMMCFLKKRILRCLVGDMEDLMATELEQKDPANIGFWIFSDPDFAGMPRSVGCSAASWIRCLVGTNFGMDPIHLGKTKTATWVDPTVTKRPRKQVPSDRTNWWTWHCYCWKRSSHLVISWGLLGRKAPSWVAMDDPLRCGGRGLKYSWNSAIVVGWNVSDIGSQFLCNSGHSWNLNFQMSQDFRYSAHDKRVPEFWDLPLSRSQWRPFFWGPPMSKKRLKMLFMFHHASSEIEPWTKRYVYDKDILCI